MVTGYDGFVAFARLQGVNIDVARLVADGRVHRADVGDTPSGRGDAAYVLRQDGTGWVTNFKAAGKPIEFRPELAREPTAEELAKMEADRQAWRQQRAEEQAIALGESLERWRESHEPHDFPYLRNPVLQAHGLRQGRAQLLVPMLAVDADGEPGWVGMQRISWDSSGASAAKRFVSGTPTRGSFAVVPIMGADEEAPLRAYEAACAAAEVVMCEGIGNALAIHQATGLPVVAALSAQNLPEVARSLQERLQGTVVVYADADGERAGYKGQLYAVRAARILGTGRARVALPARRVGVTPPGHDARDQFREGGPAAIRATLDGALRADQVEARIPGRFKTASQEAPRRPAREFGRHGEESAMNEQVSGESGAELARVVAEFNKVRDPERRRALQQQIRELRANAGRAKAAPGDVEQMPPAAEPAQPVTAREGATAEPKEGDGDIFAELNQAAAEADKAVDAGVGQEAGVGEETPEERLLREYREHAASARDACAKARGDLAGQQREDRLAFFETLEQLRADKMREFAGHGEEQRRSLIAMEVAKAVERIQQEQALARKDLEGQLPAVPTLVSFLSERAARDPEAQRLLDEERRREGEASVVMGRRRAGLDAAVLEGLTHEIEDGPKGTAVHFLRDGARVLSDHGDRLELHRADDREIEAALRLAEQKYDVDAGLVLTGGREFRERAAEIAGRLGLKVRDADLQGAWEAGRRAAVEAEGGEAALPLVLGVRAPLGGIQVLGSDRGEVPRVEGGVIEVGDRRTAAEFTLARLSWEGVDALEAAGRGEVLTAEQRGLLRGEKLPELVDGDDQLTDEGRAALDAMRSRRSDEAQQQQLRTRNVDEALEREDEHHQVHEAREAEAAGVAERRRGVDAAEVGAER